MKITTRVRRWQGALFTLLLSTLPTTLFAEDADRKERIELMEQWANPITFKFLEKLPIKEGWHCLEVGAQHGALSRWLAERVGDEGHVDATDRLPDGMGGLDLPNVTVSTLDVVRDPLPSNHYDCIVARDVLMNVQQREALVQKLTHALKSGGILMVEDLARLPHSFNYKEISKNPNVVMLANTLMHQVEARGRISFLSAYDNPRYFEAAGLTNVSGQIIALRQQGNSAEGKVMAKVLDQHKPLFLSQGYDPIDYDAFTHAFLNPNAHWWGLARVFTFGVKP